MNRGFALFMAGILIGYCLVQGMAYFQNHYLWTVFYR